MKKAVILLSGGLDSATALAVAGQGGFECHALIFDYGQRHAAEVKAAHNIANACPFVTQCRLIPLALGELGNSALTDANIPVPDFGSVSKGIPATYVPARNTVFLSYAMAWAETLNCGDIFIGVNAIDYSGYPDCRPEYIEAFEKMANLATKATVEGWQRTRIHTPLMDLDKAEIVTLGAKLGVNYAITVSCYQADSDGRACGHCESCHFRRKGFISARLPDPTPYQNSGR
ncbi:MAG: 7-cyano-7-deazaguanine synthase QueC [Candidatus Eutrophobiaceae bacterium]